MDFRSLKMRKTRWVVLLPLLVTMITLFIVGKINNDRMVAERLQQEQQLSNELGDLRIAENQLRIQVDAVDSNGQLDAAARAEAFVKPGELRFFIDNSEGQLDMYTKEELQLLLEERKKEQY